MILRVHAPDPRCYAVGDEIWHDSLADAIRAEVAIVADEIGADERGRVIDEMTEALVRIGDSYLAAGGVRYSLVAEADGDPDVDDGRLGSVSDRNSAAVVKDVLRFEDLPVGSLGSRRAVVRWSDGSEGEALRWYADEVLVCEGDLIDKTQSELRSLHFRRDRDWLQS